MKPTIDIQDRVLVLATADGQIATIDTSGRAPDVQQAIAQFVLEARAAFDGETVEILHVKTEGAPQCAS